MNGCAMAGPDSRTRRDDVASSSGANERAAFHRPRSAATVPIGGHRAELAAARANARRIA
jgi:hypothetical protein